MQSLKETRSRIETVRSTRKITSAMKMVSASRLRKVQNNIVHLRYYSSLLRQILEEVTEQLPISGLGVFLKERPDIRDVLVISIGSNKGLCGTYNALVIKHTLGEIDRLRKEGSRVRLFTVGKRIEKFFTGRGFDIAGSNNGIIDKFSFGPADEFASAIMDMFLKENAGRILVVYNRFENAIVHRLTTEQLIPVPGETMMQAEREAGQELYEDPVILEPSSVEVAEAMCRRYISYNVYRIMLDASASEHGSRMTAMHKATDNADDMLRALTLKYNKARQASVTRELMDIIGGTGREDV